MVHDSSGRLVYEHRFGNLSRNHATALNVTEHLQALNRLTGSYGHVELVYDFDAGTEADGWLHALFRYTDRESGHVAETNFGSHIFNTVLTYQNEPQSYKGRPPGLSTQLFLRVGESGYQTFCHLIYPASTPWHENSNTVLTLFDAMGKNEHGAKFQSPAVVLVFGTFTNFSAKLSSGRRKADMLLFLT